MTLIQALILGLLQGLTEFLPVSSTAHLVIAQNWLGLVKPPVELDVIVHLATALVTVLVLWPVIKKINFKLVKFIFLALIPTGILGLWFKQWEELIFGSLLFSAITLIINGLILLLPKIVKNKVKELNSKNSLLIGTAQGLAVLPGISRSGATIVAGLLTGIKPADAYNFSFLISLPAIAAAMLLQLTDLPAGQWFNQGLLVGFMAAFISGLFALKILKKFVSRGQFTGFAYYCLALGLILLLL
jgi:undecaprenyl-diphosphatase